MAPSSLFKYQSIDDYSLANLRDSGLWCSAPVDFNDPLDCGLVFWKEDLEDADYDRLFASQIERRGLDLALTLYGELGPRHPRFRTAMTRAIETSGREQVESHRYVRGVACFSETGDNLLMWAHYADRHRGFCVEFDGAVEPFRLAQQVVYSESVPQLNLVDLIDTLPEDRRFEQAMRLTKSSCWAYEKEWRLIHAASKTRFKYPAIAVTRIHLGVRVTGENEDKLTAVAKQLGVPLSRMRLEDRSFAVQSHPV